MFTVPSLIGESHLKSVLYYNNQYFYLFIFWGKDEQLLQR